MPDKTILLVEDNPDDTELTMYALQANNFANPVVHVKDGVEALDYLFATGTYSDRDPDELPTLVLLDLKLPRIDGLEVLKRVRENERTRFVPIVILTSSKEEQDLIKGYGLGCNSYVRKPVDFDEFQTAVRNLGLYWLLLNVSPETHANRKT
jgi:two-component system response regulator